MKITKDTTLGQLLDKSPEALKVLEKYMGKVGCLTCPGRVEETLEMGVLIHGVEDKDFKKMLKELQEKFGK